MELRYKTNMLTIAAGSLPKSGFPSTQCVVLFVAAGRRYTVDKYKITVYLSCFHCRDLPKDNTLFYFRNVGFFFFFAYLGKYRPTGNLLTLS